jgi:hypothetical protein
MSKAKYPKTLVHPAYTPAVIPPVTVNNLDLEKEYLAKGYIPLARPPRPPRGMRPADIGAPPLAEQRFDKAAFETQLNSASQNLLEDRKAAAETAAKLGHLSLMVALELIEMAGYPRALPRLVAAAVFGKIKLRGIVDGKPQKKIKPMWLHYLAFEPDGDVLYFDRDAARQKGVVAPTRASNVTVEISGIEALWPGATQPQPSDESTKTTSDNAARGTVELGAPNTGTAGAEESRPASSDGEPDARGNRNEEQGATTPTAESSPDTPPKKADLEQTFIVWMNTEKKARGRYPGRNRDRMGRQGHRQWAATHGVSRDNVEGWAKDEGLTNERKRPAAQNKIAGINRHKFKSPAILAI